MSADIAKQIESLVRDNTSGAVTERTIFCVIAEQTTDLDHLMSYGREILGHQLARNGFNTFIGGHCEDIVYYHNLKVSSQQIAGIKNYELIRCFLTNYTTSDNPFDLHFKYGVVMTEKREAISSKEFSRDKTIFKHSYYSDIIMDIPSREMVMLDFEIFRKIPFFSRIRMNDVIKDMNYFYPSKDHPISVFPNNHYKHPPSNRENH